MSRHLDLWRRLHALAEQAPNTPRHLLVQAEQLVGRLERLLTPDHTPTAKDPHK